MLKLKYVWLCECFVGGNALSAFVRSQESSGCAVIVVKPSAAIHLNTVSFLWYEVHLHTSNPAPSCCTLSQRAQVNELHIHFSAKEKAKSTDSELLCVGGCGGVGWGAYRMVNQEQRHRQEGERVITYHCCDLWPVFTLNMLRVTMTTP